MGHTDPQPDSPFYWFTEIMKATSREARREILKNQVPAHLQDLVEYTVTDHFTRRRFLGGSRRHSK